MNRRVDDYEQQQRRLIAQLKQDLAVGEVKGSIVAMRSDYEQAIELALTSVAFPPPEIAQAVVQTVIEPLQQIEPDHFYYRPDFLHFTIKNIRQMHHPPTFTEADVAQVNGVFQQLIPTLPAFTFQLDELLLFPTSAALIAYSNATLGQLVQSLDTALRAIGLTDDKRYISDRIFFGNMTVCRFRHPPSAAFRQAIQHLAALHLPPIPITQVHLITCNCVCSPHSRRLIATHSLQSRL